MGEFCRRNREEEEAHYQYLCYLHAHKRTPAMHENRWMQEIPGHDYLFPPSLGGMIVMTVSESVSEMEMTVGDSGRTQDGRPRGGWTAEVQLSTAFIYKIDILLLFHTPRA